MLKLLLHRGDAAGIFAADHIHQFFRQLQLALFYLLALADDPDVKDVLRFLRAREIVHYQRFAEGLELMKDQLDERNFYAFNAAMPPALRACGCHDD